jgi:hypothetical protein
LIQALQLKKKWRCYTSLVGSNFPS